MEAWGFSRIISIVIAFEPSLGLKVCPPVLIYAISLCHERYSTQHNCISRMLQAYRKLTICIDPTETVVYSLHCQGRGDLNLHRRAILLLYQHLKQQFWALSSQQGFSTLSIHLCSICFLIHLINTWELSVVSIKHHQSESITEF